MLYFHFDKLSVTTFCQAELVKALSKRDSFLSG